MADWQLTRNDSKRLSKILDKQGQRALTPAQGRVDAVTLWADPSNHPTVLTNVTIN